ncbi:MAG: glycoside hydrolase family 5 protein, partial [Fibrobacteraceae bacterium]
MKKIFFVPAILAISTALSAALPKAVDVYTNMGLGWNLGNTMEAPGDPTSWGNSFPTKALFDSVKAAGFTTVRIPTAWYSHADTTANIIHSSWMDSVKTVVDYCINDGLYCILNIHWDSGWLENNIFDGTHSVSNTSTETTDSASVHARQTAFWTQIATEFKDYDEHLLFAGANEPGVNDAWLTSGQVPFTLARMGILKVYEQAFIDAVRATGGNNGTRTLIVQAPRTEITLADSLLKSNMPTDPAGTGYIMAEAHFYPYQFSMMTKDESWGTQYFYWDGYNSTTDLTHNTGWNVYSKSQTTYETGAWVDSVFAVMQTDFYSQGIPVVIGEFGAFKRLGQLSGDSLRLHLLSRAAFYGKVASSAKAHGLVPIAWDTGDEGSTNSTIIRRQKGTGIYDYEVLNAMRKAYGLDT